MNHRNLSRRSFIAAAAIGTVALARAGRAGTKHSAPLFFFVYFKEGERHALEGKKLTGGGAGAYLAWSQDGLDWREANSGRHVFKQHVGKMCRDPFIARGPDNTFHLTWTTGWQRRDIGYACSSDLVHWQNEKLIPVMGHEPAAMNCWAPEIFYDDLAGQFIVFWSTTIPGAFPETQGAGDGPYNHRIYFTTTRDFVTFAPAALLYDPGSNCIDADIVKADDGYVMILKNETRYPPAKNLIMSRAKSPAGPWGPPTVIVPEGAWVEGPATIKINDHWLVYYDRYVERKYGVIASSDLIKWENWSDRLRIIKGAKHCGIFAIGKDELAKLAVSLD